MSLELYGLAKCGTCVKARDWLNAQGIAHRFIDYREHPLAPSTLVSWAKVLGGWEKLVNRASMTWRGLSDAQKTAGSEAEWLALIRDYPALVRRPVVVQGERISVGFSAQKFAELKRGWDARQE